MGGSCGQIPYSQYCILILEKFLHVRVIFLDTIFSHHHMHAVFELEDLQHSLHGS